jgi:hypothetical protein
MMWCVRVCARVSPWHRRRRQQLQRGFHHHQCAREFPSHPLTLGAPADPSGCRRAHHSERNELVAGQSKSGVDALVAGPLAYGRDRLFFSDSS